MAVLKKTKTARYYDPLNIHDHWRAKLDGYNSKNGECPFYDQKRLYRCELTQDIHYIIDCYGKCFKYGFCCVTIHQALERNDLDAYNEVKIFYDRGNTK